MRWLWLPILVACASGPSERDRPPPFLLERETLLAMPLDPIVRDPFPEAFARSREIYDRAFAAYRARAYLRAADEFVGAALALVGVTGGDADIASRNRAALFYNAALAWVAANQPQRGRAALGRLRARGQAAAEELRRAFGVLE